MEIGSIIMKKRKELGITQQVLAKNCMCQIRRYQNGKMG